jgi:hypothetical protein
VPAWQAGTAACVCGGSGDVVVAGGGVVFDDAASGGIAASVAAAGTPGWLSRIVLHAKEAAVNPLDTSRELLNVCCIR